jgi:hypothetical protein
MGRSPWALGGPCSMVMDDVTENFQVKEIVV